MISVVVTCHNSGSYLEQALESVWNQSYRDWELIAVDDGSVNDTWMRLEVFQKRDTGRIKVFHRESNGSPSAAKNYGISHISGDFVYILDHDDFLTPDVLENCAKRAQETCADAVLPDCITFEDSTNKILSKQIGLHGDRSVILTGREAVHWSLDWTIHGFALWRADLLKSHPFDEKTTNGDELTSRELFLNCQKVSFSSGELRYRHIPGSVTFVKQFCARIYDPYKMACQLSVFLKDNDFPGEDIDLQEYRTFCTLRYAYRRYFFFRAQKKLPDEFSSEKFFFDSFAAIDRSFVRRCILQKKPSLRMLLDLLTLSSFPFFRLFSRIMACK